MYVMISILPVVLYLRGIPLYHIAVDLWYCYICIFKYVCNKWQMWSKSTYWHCCYLILHLERTVICLGRTWTLLPLMQIFSLYFHWYIYIYFFNYIFFFFIYLFLGEVHWTPFHVPMLNIVFSLIMFQGLIIYFFIWF